MPWSTWTTKSPTFRSRRSERNARVADRRRCSGAARSSSKTSASAYIVSWPSGRRKPRARCPTVTSSAAKCASSVRSAGVANDLVVLEQLDHPLGASGGGRHEDRLFAVAATLPQRLEEVLDASLELGDDLTAHVMHVGRTRGSCLAFFDRELLEPHGIGEPPENFFGRHKEPLRRRHRTAALVRSWPSRFRSSRRSARGTSPRPRVPARALRRDTPAYGVS